MDPERAVVVVTEVDVVDRAVDVVVERSVLVVVRRVVVVVGARVDEVVGSRVLVVVDEDVLGGGRSVVDVVVAGRGASVLGGAGGGGGSDVVGADGSGSPAAGVSTSMRHVRETRPPAPSTITLTRWEPTSVGLGVKAQAWRSPMGPPSTCHW